MIASGQLVILISPKGKRYTHKLVPGNEVHTQEGKISLDEVAEVGFGGCARTHLGKPFLVLKPTVYDLIKGVKRQTQIMYPKEIGYLLLKLGIGPGSTVIESGTGSAGLTLALAWFVGDTGKVYTYERREDFFKLAMKNLDRVGLLHRVEQVNQDIEQGFKHTGADALFLDVREPWLYLSHIPKAVLPGAMCGFLLPTTNQVSDLLRGLDNGPFVETEVLEILVRRYKPVADRLRPDDRMVAHTGFLIFSRYMEKPEPLLLPETDTAETDPSESDADEEPLDLRDDEGCGCEGASPRS